MIKLEQATKFARTKGILTDFDSRASQKAMNLNRCCKPEICIRRLHQDKALLQHREHVRGN